jgi:hypothetical protein
MQEKKTKAKRARSMAQKVEFSNSNTAKEKKYKTQKQGTVSKRTRKSKSVYQFFRYEH